MKKMIIKWSGEALQNKQNSSLYDFDYIEKLCGFFKELNQEISLSIVVGGGNIWRGRSDGRLRRDDADQIGMLATVQNAIVIKSMLSFIGAKAVIISAYPISTITQQYHRESVLEYINRRYIVIFAGGTGHPYFSTDSLTSLRALELEADEVVFTKHGVNGIYDCDPNFHPNAKRFKKISCQRAIENPEIQVIDQSALCMMNDFKRNFHVVSGDFNEIRKIVQGVPTGTLVTYRNEESEFYE